MKKIINVLLALFVLSSCASAPAQKEPVKKIATCVEKKTRTPTGALFAWMKKTNTWPKKDITVSFLNGTSRLKRETWKRFQQWDNLLGITFTQVNCCGDIRVKFSNEGHWSYVGRYNLSVPMNEQTMNLAFSFDEMSSEIDRVVLHEVGHALGLEHEHQHPTGIPWNIPKVIAYYKTTQGWDEEEIYQQVINKYNGENFNGTEFDKDSIMLYPVNREHTLNGFSVGWNSKLSTKDISFLQSVYGPN